MKWPFVIVGVAVALLSLPGDVRIEASRYQPQNGASDIEAIHAYITRLKDFGFSGGVVIGERGKVLLESLQGLADRENNLPVRMDTVFDIGSVTKQFTAAAIVALEADGKLRVTDRVDAYFDGAPEDKAGITLHQLLTHTSGLAMDFGGGDYDRVPRAEIVRRAFASKLRSTPGERHAYSNAGYSLLAAIVEIASGRTYEEYLTERLFRPLGMLSTGYTFFPAEEARYAKGYRRGQLWGTVAKRTVAAEGDFWNLIGNGGMHSTLSDMFRWVSALDEGKALTPEARRKLFEPHVVAINNYQGVGTLYYGYGWYVWKQAPGKTLIFHLGGNFIFNAALRYHVETRKVVVYLTNVSEFNDPQYPVPAVEKMLVGERVPLPPRVVALSPSQLDRHKGRYRGASGAVLTVDATSSLIRVQGEGQEAYSYVVGSGWKSAEGLDALNARVLEIVEKTRVHDYEKLMETFEPGMTLRELSELENTFWTEQQEKFGPYVRARVLGTKPAAGRNAGTTMVAIDFERGTWYHDYLWTRNGKLADLGPLSAAPSKVYFPESAECFISVEPASAEVSRICFSSTATDSTTATLTERGTTVELKKL